MHSAKGKAGGRGCIFYRAVEGRSGGAFFPACIVCCVPGEGAALCPQPWAAVFERRGEGPGKGGAADAFP